MDNLLVGQEILSLRSGAVEATLMPGAGGSLRTLSWNGKHMLRPGQETRDRDLCPLEMAAFPLVPFSGRIAYGSFDWREHRVKVSPNFAPEPHAIHGFGWRKTWTVEQAGADYAVLELRHPGGEWPWAFIARQEFGLRSDGLHLLLSLTNEGAFNMPAGLGWHPYFPVSGAYLQADVQSVWSLGQDRLPTRPVEVSEGSNLRVVRRVSELDLDHPFQARYASARMCWPSNGYAIEMTGSSTLGHLVVFTPPREQFFCVEPVSHVPNAHNMDAPGELTGLTELQPGETMTAEIDLNFLHV